MRPFSRIGPGKIGIASHLDLFHQLFQILVIEPRRREITRLETAIAQRRRYAKRQVEFRQVRRLRVDVSQKVDRGLVDPKIDLFHVVQQQRLAPGCLKHCVDGGIRMAAGGVILDRVTL